MTHIVFYLTAIRNMRRGQSVDHYSGYHIRFLRRGATCDAEDRSTPTRITGRGIMDR